MKRDRQGLESVNSVPAAFYFSGREMGRFSDGGE